MAVQTRLTLVKRRVVCAWLGLVLILANVVLGLAAGPQPMTVVSDQAGDSVVICSVHGAFTVKADDAPAQQHDQDSQDHGLCPCCLPLSWGGAAALVASVTTLPLPPESRGVALAWGAADAPTALPDKGRLARAPPSAA